MTDQSRSPAEQPEPEWVRDGHRPRTTPYTDEELDLLVQGVMEGIKDTPAWHHLVRKVGEPDAMKILRAGIRGRGPGPYNEEPNRN